MTADELQKLRDTIADHFEALNHFNKQWVRDIRAGRQDTGILMTMAALGWKASKQ